MPTDYERYLAAKGGQSDYGRYKEAVGQPKFLSMEDLRDRYLDQLGPEFLRGDPVEGRDPEQDFTPPKESLFDRKKFAKVGRDIGATTERINQGIDQLTGVERSQYAEHPETDLERKFRLLGKEFGPAAQMGSQAARTVGRAAVGALGFLGSLPKYLDPQPGELGQDVQSIRDQVASVPISVDYRVRKLLGAKDPSANVSPYSPITGLTSAIKGEPITPEVYRKAVTGAVSESPESPLFGAAIGTGAVKAGLKGARALPEFVEKRMANFEAEAQALEQRVAAQKAERTAAKETKQATLEEPPQTPETPAEVRPTSPKSGAAGAQLPESVRSLPKEEVSPLIKSLDELEVAARERLKERNKSTTLGFGGLQELPNFADYAIIGAAKLAKGTVKFAQWSSEMVSEFGDKIRPHLRQLYNESQKRLGEEVKIRRDHVNLNRMNVGEKGKTKISEAVNDIRTELEDVKGRTLTNEEVVEAAKTSQVLQKVSTREQTLAAEAAALRARQNLAALAEEQGAGLTRDFLEALKVVSADATKKGRELQALSIDALGLKGDASLTGFKLKVVKRLLDLGHAIDDILAAAEGVDFNNAAQVTEFYRTFVKPTVGELITEARYGNVLSSPLTHIRNAFTNLYQAGVARPSVRLVSGAIDRVGSSLTGKEREYYVRQVPVYYRGMINSFPDAISGVNDVFKGQMLVERPDISYIPTGNKYLKYSQRVTQALEAGDVFFRRLIEGAEREALDYRNRRGGKQLSESEINKEARSTGEELLFRSPVDFANKSKQGHLLSAIDGMTSAVYSIRNKVPLSKFYLMFVRTPMNIFKQGIEYSPAGFATIPGSGAKTIQFSKAAIGSTVFLGTGWMAMEGRLTWAVPTRKAERDAFYASGRQPYSIKVGDQWVQYNRIGPLAFPMAMAASLYYHTQENPNALTDSDVEKITAAIGGVARFFSDQSYLEGISDFVNLVGRGEARDFTNFATNVPSQLIPLSSLQRWTANIIDPYYRKTSNKLTVDALVGNLKKGIPFLSQTVEPHTNPDGTPARRQLRGLNAVSPVRISSEDRDAESKYQNVKDFTNYETAMRKLRDMIRDDDLDTAEQTYAAIKERWPYVNHTPFQALIFSVRKGQVSSAKRQATKEQKQKFFDATR